jgi:hypothetical protein
MDGTEVYMFNFLYGARNAARFICVVAEKVVFTTVLQRQRQRRLLYHYFNYFSGI